MSATCAAILLAGAGTPAADAQGLAPGASQAAAAAALTVLGIAATPNDTLPSLSFLNAAGMASVFRSTQFRGGLDLGANPAIHIEGLVAYQIYNPVDVFPDIIPGTSLDLTWTAIAGTAGLGYNLPLRAGWTLRPMAHLSLGYVTTDAFLSGLPIVPLSTQASEAVEGGLRSGGVGASVGLIKETRIGRWDVEYRFRHTYLGFFPVDAPSAGDATAVANQTTFASRHRLPLPAARLAGRPIRAVLDAGIVLYHGDGARVLGTNWLGTLGAGLELDMDGSGAPLPSAGRIMLNGVVGDGYTGYSIGLGLRF